jgi:hypothetical protein
VITRTREDAFVMPVFPAGMILAFLQAYACGLSLSVVMLTATLIAFRLSWCEASEKGRGLLILMLIFAFQPLVSFLWCMIFVVWVILYRRDRKAMREWHSRYLLERWREEHPHQALPHGAVSLAEHGALSICESGNLSLLTPKGRASSF